MSESVTADDVAIATRDSVTAEDLAIEAAKERLVELAQRDEYKAAIARVKKPDRGTLLFCAISCIAATIAAVGLSWIASGPAWLGVFVLAAFAIFMGLGWLGISQDKPGKPFGVAVVGKATDKKGRSELELLCTDGETIRTIVDESLYNAVRPGDLGVAWIRKASINVLTEFERL